MDRARIQEGVRLILEGVGENPLDPRLAETPRRVADMLEEVLEGTHCDPRSFLSHLAEERHDEMVILRNIPIHSMCEHHLLPFYGFAHLAYIPAQGRIAGLSTLARVVDTFAKRLQIQERLTKQIADTLMDALHPLGVMVVIQAEHLCMGMRGARKPGATTLTSAVRGIFRRKLATREEAMSLLMRS